MKKLIFILIAFIICYSNSTKAQDQLLKRKSIIKGFVSAVFEDKKPARFIIDNFMSLTANDTLSMVRKESVVSHMIDTLVKKNSQIIASSDYKIFTYNNFKGQKKEFNTTDFKNIMIVAVNGKAVIYFYFSKDRIMSFFTIEKGSVSFFITI